MDVFTFKFRRGQASEWTTANPILAEGEPGVELDTKRLKIGDGVQRWTALPYYLSEDAINDYINDVVANLEVGEPQLSDLVLLWQNSKA